MIRLWRPFLSCFSRMRQQFNARHSIIDAFATLYFLKFVSISGDLLILTQIFNINGSHVGYFMYYDATVEFLGPEHLPYFIIAIAVTFTVASFPLLLLLYPMKIVPSSTKQVSVKQSRFKNVNGVVSRILS